MSESNPTRDQACLLMLESRVSALEAEVARLRRRGAHYLVQRECPECRQDFEHLSVTFPSACTACLSGAGGVRT